MSKGSYTVWKDFSFASAHRLPKHMGKCYNLHGHNYKLRVVLQGSNLDKADFLIDFGEISKIVNEAIINKVDHAFIGSKEDMPLDGSQKRYDIDFHSTAENLTKHFYGILFMHYGELLKEVTLWETEKSGATYTELF